MYLTPGSDNAIVVNNINSQLSSSATQAAIASSVAADAASVSSSITALSSLAVTGFVKGESTGVSFKKWYPNWVTFGQYCTNDGLQPPFMVELVNQDEYLFATQKECCEQWYEWSEDCETLSGGDPNAERYYPDYSNAGCGKKASKDFESFETDRYDTLEQCCSLKFSYHKSDCCDSPGMGGCDTSGEVVYLPDWRTNQCFVRSKGSVAAHEENYARTSNEACCGEFFKWAGSDCLSSSATSL